MHTNCKAVVLAKRFLEVVHIHQESKVTWKEELIIAIAAAIFVSKAESQLQSITNFHESAVMGAFIRVLQLLNYVLIDSDVSSK